MLKNILLLWISDVQSQKYYNKIQLTEKIKVIVWVHVQFFIINYEAEALELEECNYCNYHQDTSNNETNTDNNLVTLPRLIVELEVSNSMKDQRRRPLLM